jgi:hypothetical protein
MLEAKCLFAVCLPRLRGAPVARLASTFSYMAAVVNYTPEELFQRAQLGATLRPKERKAVMVWLEKSGEILNWQDNKLASALGCKVGSLRKLRLDAQRVVAAAISPEQAMNYMAEFVRLHDLLIKEAVDGIKGAPKHSGAHQAYMRLLMEASGEKVAKLQSIGVIPKELGRLTTVAEEWTATITEGVASCAPSVTEQP